MTLPRPLAHDVLERRRDLTGQDAYGRAAGGFEAGDLALGVELGPAGDVVDRYRQAGAGVVGRGHPAVAAGVLGGA